MAHWDIYVKGETVEIGEKLFQEEPRWIGRVYENTDTNAWTLLLFNEEDKERALQEVEKEIEKRGLKGKPLAVWVAVHREQVNFGNWSSIEGEE